MNKLLLLATSLFCLTCLEGYSLGAGNYANHISKDSSIKDQQASDPKDAFKELFESESSNNASAFKLNPKAVSFVQDYWESEGDRLTKMKDWAKPFFDRIDKIFSGRNLPVELKYLAVIESDLKASATSRVGAAGPWQFMAETARDLGLKVSRKTDERRDFNKSTVAAAKYLKALYTTYNDWLLVIAAYNCGGGVVNSAIRKAGSSNFWDLQYHLPKESRNHVKKFIATHYIMEGDGGLTTLTKKETEALARAGNIEVLDPNSTILNISGKYNSLAITQNIQMNIADFNKLNPDFDRQLSANGTYNLRLPNDKMLAFQSSKQQILDQSIQILLNSLK
ncbi:MAG TPA: lytic transglycosylase domain-containing protein [Flavisolibacter sp.]|nr:lytic transglycosylase domain-containing protein [Flavisolibacter sp.]